jgi:hypothetical protein
MKHAKAGAIILYFKTTINCKRMDKKKLTANALSAFSKVYLVII